MIAKEYAQALFELKAPNLAVVRAVLARRGHEKLLPAIYAEYQKLVLKTERLRVHGSVTPEKERARVLRELYQKLVATK